MIAKGAFAAQFAQLDVAFEDDFSVGGNLEIDGFALDDFDGLAAQEAGDEILLDLGRSGDDGGESCGRIGADGHGNFEARAFEIAQRHLRKAADGTVRDGDSAACRLGHGRDASGERIFGGVGCRSLAQGFAIVLGGDLLPLPVHAGGLSVVNLHAVHADVALARARVAGDDAGEGDEAAAVMRPALEDGKVVEVEVVAANTFLAGGVFGADGFGEGAGERAQLREHFELVEKAFRGFQVHQRMNPFGDFVKPFDAESQRHAPLAAELIDEDLVAGMALDVLEEQGGTTAL